MKVKGVVSEVGKYLTRDAVEEKFGGLFVPRFIDTATESVCRQVVRLGAAG